MKIIFFISLVTLMYVYIGYPLILLILATIKRQKHKIDENFCPPISIIIPAYNEEEVIEKKLNNILSLDYPGEIEIIVASDGSTDKTLEFASKITGTPERKIILKNFKPRIGKMGVLNKIISEIKNEYLVLTDANAMFKKDALKKLMRNFVDQNIGCVGGVKSIVNNGEIGKYEGFYWKFESFLKREESKISSSFVDGSIYAIKRTAYSSPLEKQIVMDDLAVSLGVINKHYRVIFEPEAIAYESASKRVFDEFQRKIRILEGALTAIRISPIKKMAFQIISHKILRWTGGIFMLVLFISNLFIYCKGTIYCAPTNQGLEAFPTFYTLFLLLQLCFYSFALIGLIIVCFNRIPHKLFYIPFYFCLTNIAQIIGFIKYIRGPRKPAWEKIERS